MILPSKRLPRNSQFKFVPKCGWCCLTRRTLPVAAAGAVCQSQESRKQQVFTCRINTMDAAVLATGSSLSVSGFNVTSGCSPILRTGAIKLEDLLRCWQRKVNYPVYSMAQPSHSPSTWL
ncbi:hypothetical protein BC629DRAFT_1227553 [Irpex lacteus]|nr:hypothetical protein BC629DRAFT_1227553 [Irpex lacteus]